MRYPNVFFYLRRHRELQKNDFRDKQGELKLMVAIGGGTAPSHLYHLPGNVISRTVGLVYINRMPVYELPSSTRFGKFLQFENFE